MTTAANPRYRLAPRTSAQICAPCTQNTLKRTLPGIQKTLHRTCPIPRLNARHHHRRKTPPPTSLRQAMNAIQSP